MKRKIVIASDSFKGTLSSLDICHLFKEEIEKSGDVTGIYIPIADGGEGSLDAISNIIEGRYIDIEINDLYFKKIKTHFYIDKKNNAYIETASCAGLGLANEDNNPGLVTTYGLGEQIKEAIKLGAKNIYIFLGGSATNDGGVGLASAVGTKFYNKNNDLFTPLGLSLNEISHIDNKETEKLLKDVNIYALSDVKSPLFGPEGAAYKFSPQKGANEETVRLLDNNLKHLAAIINKDLNKSVDTLTGGGAAGGLGAGLFAFLDAKISSGIETILDLIDFDNIIKDADLVVSGEGKFDKQTLDGKVIDGIAKRCLKVGTPLDIIIGITEVSYDDIKKQYPIIRDIYETNEEHRPFSEVKNLAVPLYQKQIKKLLKK